jgi:hypothetical protein
MGQSTDAILCYGFRIITEDGEEEIAIPWLRKDLEDDNCHEMLDWTDFLIQLEGLEQPDMSDELYEKDKEEWDRLFKKWYKIGNDLEEKCPITLVSHCSAECPMYILAIKESIECARRGYPVEFSNVDKFVNVNRQKMWYWEIESFCRSAKIEFKEPKWILCSDWH